MKRILATLLFLLVSAPAAVGQSSSNPSLDSDWILSLGTAFVTTDPKVGLGLPGGEVPLIDLDRLGVDDEDNDFYGRILWQGPERWRLTFTTYLSSIDGGRFTDRDLMYGDLEIPAGSGVAVEFDSRFYILNAHYAMWQRPRWEAGVGFGVYALDWDGSIGLVDGGTGQVLERRNEDFLAPLPTLALFGRWAFTDRLAGNVSLDWLSADIGDYDGDVLVLTAGLDWWFTDRWGLSGGLQLVDIDVTVDDEPFTEFLEADWESLFLDLNFAF